MRRGILFLAFSGLFLFKVVAQEKFIADTSKTQLMWVAEKVTGQHMGTIKLQSGWLNWGDFKIASGEFYIDMSSLREADRNKQLEGHLKSVDFFDIEKYPLAKLIITGSSLFDNGNGVVSGTLTIKGITNPIKFKVAMQVKDDGIWFYTNIVVDRTKFDIRYGSSSFFDNLGDKTIYDEFRLRVNLLVKKQQ